MERQGLSVEAWRGDWFRASSTEDVERLHVEVLVSEPPVAQSCDAIIAGEAEGDAEEVGLRTECLDMKEWRVVSSLVSPIPS